MASDISICNTALLLVGANEIANFEESTREAKVAAQVYQVTKEEVLQTRAWTFSINQVSLARLADSPLYEYEYAYQLPADIIKLISTNIANNEYRIFEDKLYTNANSVNVIYQFDIGEDQLPAYFIRLLEYKLCTLFGAALPQDNSIVTLYTQLYNQQQVVSKAIDAQQQPPVGADDSFSLINARS